MKLMKAILALVVTSRDLRRKMQEATRLGLDLKEIATVGFPKIVVATAFCITLGVTVGLIR
ncbi:hypothetical protein GR212_15795 [Rhizobium lusitanum]|uniref:Uncharacterized protein n=1 Tax=Rhizobium lusitanum TaxID=293958 RepID=A0A6L9U9P8_9HYPH|nr:hypothetical protein [Rhizobium lusitanum]NEI71042.1 hypothetical protein [Rhizobium lusitanum]